MKHLIAFIGCLSACESTSPELERWLEDWEATRSCLVGNREGLADLTTAMKIARLRDARCTPPEPAISAKLDAETAELWQHAVHRVADLFAIEEPGARAVALLAIDASIAKLQRHAGIEPIERTPTAPLRALEPGRGLSIEGRAVTERELTSYAPVTARRRRSGETVHELTFDGIDAKVLSRPWDRYDAVFVRPSGAWFVWARLGREDRFQLSDRPHPVREIPYWMAPRFAIDAGAVRLIALEPTSDVAFQIALSTDRGASWQLISAPEQTRFTGASQDPVTGTIHVFIRDLDAMWMYEIAHAALAEIVATRRLPAARRIDDAHRSFQSDDFLGGERRIECRSQRTVWVDARDALLRIDATGSTWFSHLRRGAEDPIASVSCNDQIAVTLRRDPDVLDRCISNGCGPVLEVPKGIRGAATLHTDGTWMYAASIDDVVGIWREHASPRFYRLAVRGQVVGFPQFGGVPHLAVSTSAGIRFVRVP